MAMDSSFQRGWYQAAPSEGRAQRRTLGLGLGPAVRHFTDLVVPGLGRVWFVRQLSWAVAGLKLSTEQATDGRSYSATACALGVEALACKLAFERGTNLSRVIGMRAFTRDQANPSTRLFRQLIRMEHYVANSYRAGTVRALTVRGVANRPPGLGLATGSRFSGMVLTSEGVELAEAFLARKAGNSNVEASLLRWLGTAKPPKKFPPLRGVLEPTSPTKKERRLVAGRLVNAHSLEARKRKQLARILVRSSTRPGVRTVISALRKAGGESKVHADQIELAFAFGAMLEEGQSLIRDVTVAMEKGLEIPSADLARRKAVRRRIARVLEASRHYAKLVARNPGFGHPTANAFASAIRRASANAPGILEFVVSRDGKILRRADSGKITRGALFTSLVTIDEPQDEDGAVDPESRAGNRNFGLANLHALARDIGREYLR